LTNEVVSGVVKCIADEFGDDYKIYTEMVEQGFKEPCFFVAVAGESITPIVGKRYNLSHNIEVIYSPEKGEQRDDIYNVMLPLLDALEYIDVDGPVMGKNISGEILSDEAGMYLSVSVTYEYTVYKQRNDNTVFMGELKQEVQNG
jgi:hypothetical protein